LSNITSLSIPNSVTSIAAESIQGCNALTSIALPFVGGSRAISTSGSTSYVFGYIFGTTSSSGTGTTYQYVAYSYIPTTLRTVTITDATGISANAFYNCTFLTSITINSGAQSNVGSNAFTNCVAPTYN
jgi:hypothetical protein